MTKKDLERENKFFRLQLKKIHENLESICVGVSDEEEVLKKIALCKVVSDASIMQNNLDYIHEHDKAYNFFDKDIEI